MLCYDIIDVSEGIDVSKKKLSKVGIVIALSFNHLSVVASSSIMMYQ